MARKNYRLLIEARIKWINDILGTNYIATYDCYYCGWDMYLTGPKGYAGRGALGFDYRKSSAEMLAYVDGCYTALMMPGVSIQLTKADNARDAK